MHTYIHTQAMASHLRRGAHTCVREHAHIHTYTGDGFSSAKRCAHMHAQGSAHRSHSRCIECVHMLTHFTPSSLVSLASRLRTRVPSPRSVVRSQVRGPWSQLLRPWLTATWHGVPWRPSLGPRSMIRGRRPTRSRLPGSAASRTG